MTEQQFTDMVLKSKMQDWDQFYANYSWALPIGTLVSDWHKLFMKAWGATPNPQATVSSSKTQWQVGQEIKHTGTGMHYIIDGVVHYTVNQVAMFTCVEYEPNTHATGPSVNFSEDQLNFHFKLINQTPKINPSVGVTQVTLPNPNGNRRSINITNNGPNPVQVNTGSPTLNKYHRGQALRQDHDNSVWLILDIRIVIPGYTNGHNVIYDLQCVTYKGSYTDMFESDLDKLFTVIKEDEDVLSVKGTGPVKTGCDHKYEYYHGLFEAYEFCTKCNHKKA